MWKGRVLASWYSGRSVAPSPCGKPGTPLLPNLAIQMSPCRSETVPWTLSRLEVMPQAGDSGLPARVRCETLPPGSPFSLTGSTPPQPKLPDHRAPAGAKPRPKPWPNMPPPNTGEDGVLPGPSAGDPSGLSTTRQLVQGFG